MRLLAGSAQWLNRLAKTLLFTSLLITLGLLNSCSPASQTPHKTLEASPNPGISSTPSPLSSATISPSPLLPTPSAPATVTLFPLSSTHPPSSTPSLWLFEIPFGAWNQVLAVAWSPDGKLLAASAGAQVIILESSAYQTQQTLGVGSWSDRLAFNPHPVLATSDLLAVAAKDGRIQLWNTHTGRQIAVWEAHKKGAKSLAFSPDGLTLASTGGDAMVRLWDVQAQVGQPAENPVPLAEMIGGAYVIPDVSFSPDGSLIASVDIHDIRLRDPATQRLVRTLRGDSSIFRIAFSPDGSLLASAEMGNRVCLWNLADGQLKAKWSASGGQAGDEKVFLWSLAFSPDGSLLAVGGSDGMITIWQLETGQVMRRFQAHARAVAGLAFSPDGSVLASGGLDGILRIWRR